MLGTFLPLIALGGGAGDVLDWMSIRIPVVIAFVTGLVFAKVNWMAKRILIFYLHCDRVFDNETICRSTLLKLQADDKCNFYNCSVFYSNGFILDIEVNI